MNLDQKKASLRKIAEARKQWRTLILTKGFRSFDLAQDLLTALEALEKYRNSGQVWNRIESENGKIKASCLEAVGCIADEAIAKITQEQEVSDVFR